MVFGREYIKIGISAGGAIEIIESYRNGRTIQEYLFERSSRATDVVGERGTLHSHSGESSSTCDGK